MLLDLVNDNFMEQSIRDPPRKENILYLSFANKRELVDDYEVLDNIYTNDHSTVIIDTYVAIDIKKQ